MVDPLGRDFKCWKCKANSLINCRHIKECAYIKFEQRVDLANLRPEYKPKLRRKKNATS